MPERLILVNERNRAIGTAGKTLVHRTGLLHRAFSIFLVDHRARILLQQRHPKKYHSGGLWANSCCGHPRPGERTLPAARRRLAEELGVAPALAFGFFARYRAGLDNAMLENEFVYVYFGCLRTQLCPDPCEVIDTTWLPLAEIGRRVRQAPDSYAAWLRHYLNSHFAQIAMLAQETASGRPS
jgi:isopentenyl-diphosphate delta-isomerase